MPRHTEQPGTLPDRAANNPIPACPISMAVPEAGALKTASGTTLPSPPNAPSLPNPAERETALVLQENWLPATAARGRKHHQEDHHHHTQEALILYICTSPGLDTWTSLTSFPAKNMMLLKWQRSPRRVIHSRRLNCSPNTPPITGPRTAPML